MFRADSLDAALLDARGERAELVVIGGGALLLLGLGARDEKHARDLRALRPTRDGAPAPDTRRGIAEWAALTLTGPTLGVDPTS